MDQLIGGPLRAAADANAHLANSTADFINNSLSKVTLIGAIFLGFIAIFPIIFQNLSGIQGLSLGGTTILIVVGVSLETVRSLESQMMMRHHKGFLE